MKISINYIYMTIVTLSKNPRRNPASALQQVYINFVEAVKTQFDETCIFISYVIIISTAALECCSADKIQPDHTKLSHHEK